MPVLLHSYAIPMKYTSSREYRFLDPVPIPDLRDARNLIGRPMVQFLALVNGIPTTLAISASSKIGSRDGDVTAWLGMNGVD